MAAAVATLFASCSKDATEDVVTINGDAAFVASMTFDQDATRHHINNEGKYEWEAGDMVGVQIGMAMGQQMVQTMMNGNQQATVNTANAGGVAPKFCPDCGTPTNGANFCGNCGKKLV